MNFMMFQDAMTLLISIACILGGAYLALALYMDARKRAELDGRSAFHRELLSELERQREENVRLRIERDDVAVRCFALERELVQAERLRLERDLQDQAKGRGTPS